MKNQYFGDINDYRKYGLLRMLTGEGQLKTLVCWMLTPDDGHTDGQFTRYLDEPEKWRKYDPDLFDKLQQSLHVHKCRDVQEAEISRIIPGARYFRDIVPDALPERQDWFGKAHAASTDADLVFFDPDNGLEVKSVPKGRKKLVKVSVLGRAGGHVCRRPFCSYLPALPP